MRVRWGKIIGVHGMYEYYLTYFCLKYLCSMRVADEVGKRCYWWFGNQA